MAFTLAHPYGYPLVMSRYAFDDGDQGPPDVSPHDVRGCGDTWVCEHRRELTTRMLRFRSKAGNTSLVHWRIIDDAVLSFGRGETGHVIINTGETPASVSVATGLGAGDFVDIISGRDVSIDQDGSMRVTIEPLGVVAVLGDEQ